MTTQEIEDWKTDFKYYLKSKYNCDENHANCECEAWTEQNEELMSDTEPKDAAEECVDAWYD